MSRRPSFPPPHAGASLTARRGHPRRTELPRAVEDALAVAMIVAPGVYARNRMFELFTSPGARRARVRAGVVRGVLSQLARATALTVTDAPGSADASFVLRYRIPAMSLSRVVELSAAELAALRLVAERGNIRMLPAHDGDRELVAKTLAKLMDADLSLDVSRLAREISALPRE